MNIDEQVALLMQGTEYGDRDIQRNMAEELTRNAYQLFLTNYTWDKIGVEVKNIIHFVKSGKK